MSMIEVKKRIQLENASCGHQAFQALGHIWAHAYPGNKECLITLQKVVKFYIVPPVFPRAIIPPCSANSASLLHIFATCQLRELFALCQCALFVLLAQLGPWSTLIPKSWTVMVKSDVFSNQFSGLPVSGNFMVVHFALKDLISTY